MGRTRLKCYRKRRTHTAPGSYRRLMTRSIGVYHSRCVFFFASNPCILTPDPRSLLRRITSWAVPMLSQSLGIQSRVGWPVLIEAHEARLTTMSRGSQPSHFGSHLVAGVTFLHMVGGTFPDEERLDGGLRVEG